MKNLKFKIVAFCIFWTAAGTACFGETISSERDLLLSIREDLVEKNYFSAEAKCLRLLERDPLSFSANILMGGILGSIPGREDEALAYYEKALEINGNHPGIYGEMSSLYNRLGLEDESVNILNAGVERFPDDVSLNYALGLVYLMQKQDPYTATPFFKRALEKQPENTKLIYITGLSEIMRKDVPAALGNITRLRESGADDLAAKLEELIRQLYGSGKADVSGAMDSFMEPGAPSGSVKDKSVSGEGPVSLENAQERETSLQVDPGSRKVKGTGTLTIKQTYEYDDK
jgi:tetratricopeptide (TPR) repeat protein